MRPEAGQTPALSAGEVAAALGIPEATTKRWLRRWEALGVEGIARVASRGHYGTRYAVAPDLVTRWKACLLPSPRLA